MAMPVCGEKPVDAGPIDGVAAMGSAMPAGSKMALRLGLGRW
jgi:hypothetical protein